MGTRMYLENMGNLQSLSRHLWQSLGPPPCIQVERASIHVEGLPKIHSYTKDKYWSITQCPIDCQGFLPDIHVQGSGSVQFWLLNYQSWVHELPLVQVICLCGFLQPVLTPLLLTLPFLQLYSRSSVQCLAMSVCRCFHQLLHEDLGHIRDNINIPKYN